MTVTDEMSQIKDNVKNLWENNEIWARNIQKTDFMIFWTISEWEFFLTLPWTCPSVKLQVILKMAWGDAKIQNFSKIFYVLTSYICGDVQKSLQDD